MAEYSFFPPVAPRKAPRHVWRWGQWALAVGVAAHAHWPPVFPTPSPPTLCLFPPRPFGKSLTWFFPDHLLTRFADRSTVRGLMLAGWEGRESGGERKSKVFRFSNVHMLWSWIISSILIFGKISEDFLGIQILIRAVALIILVYNKVFYFYLVVHCTLYCKLYCTLYSCTWSTVVLTCIQVSLVVYLVSLVVTCRALKRLMTLCRFGRSVWSFLQTFVPRLAAVQYWTIYDSQ